jgi:putative flippase GtrA
MNGLVRWFKFNLVGAIGMGLQLATLAALNRLRAGHYLMATAAALEVTLVHNFVLHVHYTWRDRRDDSAWMVQLIRFHVSNGLVSAAGNLGLMRMLVGEAHFPVLAANVIAILCCSIANFFIGHEWVFAASPGLAKRRVENAG